jgi:hypothetical protein
VLAATGPFDGDGTWIDPPNLGPAFHGFPLGGAWPTDSDARAGRLDTHLALLGERRAGRCGHPRRTTVTVSTGVGGAFLVDDRLVAGSRGIAGEVGHLVASAVVRAVAAGARPSRGARERTGHGSCRDRRRPPRPIPALLGGSARQDRPDSPAPT